MSAYMEEKKCEYCDKRFTQNMALLTHLETCYEREKKMNKMTYFEAVKSGKPFRIVGTQKWYESAVDVRDFIIGSIRTETDPRTYCFRLYGEIMRFMSCDFEVKEEPKVVWHIVLHDKNDSFRKTLIACENEEKARYEAMRYVSSGAWVVSLYRSEEK